MGNLRLRSAVPHTACVAYLSVLQAHAITGEHCGCDHSADFTQLPIRVRILRTTVEIIPIRVRIVGFHSADLTQLRVDLFEPAPLLLLVPAHNR